MKTIAFAFFIGLTSTCVWADVGTPSTTSNMPVTWTEEFFQTPATFPVPESYAEEGLEAVFLEGPAYQEKPTRIFAYYGVPEHEEGAKVPGMVLVHGGGGTAFPDWVRRWNKRGYAAISMDTCGGLPGGESPDHPRHEFSGPNGWGDFDSALGPVTDQWVYHAIASVLLSHSFLRSLPGVDAERIGLTGISWGGYLTCITVGVDPRFKLAAPVYGCGFLGENSTWKDGLEEKGETGQRWLELWDPKHYLPFAEAPMLWVNGTNDFAYPMDSMQKSYRLPSTARTLSIKLRMPHGHGEAGEGPEEIHTFANNILREGPPLARIVEQARAEDHVTATWRSSVPIVSAELLYTKDGGKWQDRLWETQPATLDAANDEVSVQLPDGVKVYYLNLIDSNGNIVSTEHEDLAG